MKVDVKRTKRKFDAAVQLLNKRRDRHNRNVDAVVRSHALVEESERIVERHRRRLEGARAEEPKPEPKPSTLNQAIERVKLRRQAVKAAT